ncbi:MAG: type II toxin-antitoxin system antitoxin SocA domain-containing protein, partial [Patescibacteria group bacterium]
SQEYIAKEIGVSRPTYSQIENGDRRMVVDEAQTLAKLFGLSLENFLSGKDEKMPEVEIQFVNQIVSEKMDEIPERISVPQEKVEKFREILLYILDKIGGRVNVGESVICKLLYFIDFDYYEKYEEQLIGAVYIKNHHGPTPAAFVKIVEQMQENGDLEQVLQQYYQYRQKKYLARRKADLSSFSAKELELIDWEIERFQDFNAAKMEEYSHQDVPWVSADDLQPIDYEAVFYRTPEFSVRQYDD